MKSPIPYFLYLLITIPHSCGATPPPLDVGLWLARSCAGEIGWSASDTTECAAILHMYKKRADVSPEKDILQITKEFSAAVKPRRGRENRWVLHLNRQATKPKYWPKTAKWRYVQARWLQILFLVAMFEQGRLPDPHPDMWNYGSPQDIPPPGLVRIKGTGYKNFIYRKIRKPSKPKTQSKTKGKNKP